MVATLARLRFTLLRNTLLREKWRIVLLAVGGLYALGLLAFAVAGMVALGVAADAQVRDTVLVLLGSALVLGWAIVPMVAFGLDNTLDPQRFALYLTPTPRFAFGLFVAGAVSIPGAVTVLVSVTTALAWVGSGTTAQRVSAALVALVTGLLGAATCLLLARVTTTAASGLMRGRRGRDLAGVVATGAVLVVSLVPVLLQSVGLRLSSFDALAGVLAWTPLGAPWAVPGDVVVGRWGVALARLAVVLATLALAGVLYLRLVRRSMVSVGSGQGPSAERTGRLPFAQALLREPAVASQGARAGVIAPVRLRTTPAAAAVAGRSLRYWRGDPRYLASTGAIALMPVLVLLLTWLVTSQSSDVAFREVLGWAVLALGPVTAWIGAWSIHDDIAYDSTAFWLHVAAGVRGADDRLGRVLGLAVWLVPTVVLLAVVPPVLLGRGAWVPAVLGISLVLLGGGFAVACVFSAALPYPAPPPGANPMSSQSGGSVLAFAVQLLSFAVLGLLVLPTALTLIPVFAGSTAWGWLTLAVGAVTAVVWLAVGVRWGGRILDRNAVTVLTRIRSWPRH
ncbi:hypothetical protein [Miniimonas arenae]|uniref:hypothetical protein n=1 Tax=Miniimonas arenae TaxID=676201 RepID=UPI0028A6687D|nr:hypothetical protein [Miniimonas arenae]